MKKPGGDDLLVSLGTVGGVVAMAWPLAEITIPSSGASFFAFAH